MPPRRGERGFVLLGTLWLMLLAAALLATLFLRARSTAALASAAGRDLQRSLDHDAALETVGAELIMFGAASRWAMLPATGTVELPGSSMTVKLTSENGRLDLNTTDIHAIDAALRGLGYTPSERTRFEDQLTTSRARKLLLTTADLDAAVAGLTPAPENCPADLFTMESAMPQPDPRRMDERLRKALGDPALAPPNRLGPGEPIRLETIAASGSARASVSRLGLTDAKPIETYRSWYNVCPS